MGSGRRKTKRFYIAVVGAVVAAMTAAILFLGPLRSWSIDRQIAAIEAERAIPDSENAAVLYRQFMQDFPVPPRTFYHMLSEQAVFDTAYKPWRSSDHPELADLVIKNREAITRLIEITRMRECRFPLPYSSERTGNPVVLLQDIRTWVLFLNRTINNDIGEGGIDAAIKTCASIMRLASHLYQQPGSLYYRHAMATESSPFYIVSRLIVEGNVTYDQLDKLSEALLPGNDTRQQAKWEEMKKIDALIEAKWLQEIGLVKAVRYKFEILKLRLTSDKYKDPAEQMERQYNRAIAVRRGLYILIEIRRYRNRQGHWPESLEIIRPALSDAILTDSRNGGPFFYELTDDGFRFLSLGPNKLDDGGDYREADDWPLWPTSRMVDEKKKEQNAR